MSSKADASMLLIVLVFAFALGAFMQYAWMTKKAEAICIKQNEHMSYKDVQKLCIKENK